MAFFEKLINKLFPTGDRNKPVEVLELLVRSKSYQEKYLDWKKSEQAEKLLKGVERSFYLKKNDMKGEYDVHLFKSPAANGFALTFHPDISPLEFQFLLDHWRDLTLALEYRLANTNRQIREKEDYVQTTEKHYLKPPLSKDQPLANQRYGNILLEYVLINQQPSYIKIMVTTYSDRLFTIALPYDELVDYLFTTRF